MKKIEFRHAVFLGSMVVHNQNQWQEIALVGRSNVGKSSLINHLLNQKKLAYTSSKPGKTTTLNFYKVDDSMIFVDLPGYGYAKRSHQQQMDWSRWIDLYCNQRSSLKLILLLIDIRRTLSEEDLQMIEWAHHRQKLLVLVLTKSDTLTLQERKKRVETLASQFPHLPLIDYSIKEAQSKKRLTATLHQLLWDS